MKKKLSLTIYYLFLIVFLELVYRGVILHNIFSLDTLLVIFFSIPFALLFSILSSLLSEKANRVFSIMWSLAITIIFGSQLVYFKFYNGMFSIYSVTVGTGQVFGDFLDQIITKVLENIWAILLMLLPTILFIIFGKKMFSFKRKGKKLLIKFVLFIVFITINLVTTHMNKKGMYSLYRLYKETHAPMITVNKVGLMSTEFVDLKRYLFGFQEKLYIEKKDDVINNPTEPEVKYNMVNIDFEKLKANEEDETVLSMHEYFSSLTPTKQNDYTGMFAGKNLIYITAEGFDAIAVDPVVTPTLYKLVNNGFVFENYYQPLFTVSTSDGEYMFMNSLIPKEGVWSFYRSSNIYLPYALGRTFKKASYQTVNAYHDHTYSYYYRDESHPNLGFDKYVGCGNGLELLMNCKVWPESDVEMIDATINDFINSENFMTYYMTVSGHLNYTFMGNTQSSKNRSLVADLPYSDNVRAYIAANIELDRALEKLINYLTEAGKLDDTVIVLSPDHYPYGLTKDELNEISEKDRSDKFENFHTNLILYNSAMEKNVHVTKYVSSIDVLPTIYNLFGIEFDSRLLMGRDVFSEEEGLVMLSDRSWINENGKYNSITKTFTPFKDNLPEDYADTVNLKVYQKFTMSSLILYEKNGKYLDYFRKLGI